MSRPRTAGVKLPDGIHCITKPNGRKYYYYQSKRSTKDQGPRTPLGTDPNDPEFWRLYRSAKGQTDAGTFAALIDAYRQSPEWGHLRTETKRNYSVYLDRLIEMAGDRFVRAVEARDIYQLRDSMAATPVAANKMLSVLTNGAGLLHGEMRKTVVDENI
jgi:hypothetical protein